MGNVLVRVAPTGRPARPGMRHTVVVERLVAAPPAHVWAALTEPARISQWFADTTHLHPQDAFRLEFGDGDHFVGRVHTWRESRELGLKWRFMDVGPEYDVTYRLTAATDGRTLVSVTDTGAPIESEAIALEEGWTDFLERLDRYVSTGTRTRFTWSPVISFGCFPRDGNLDTIGREWLRATFPDAVCESLRAPHALFIEFHEPRWGSTATHARLRQHDEANPMFLSVSHDGWKALAPGIEVGERRRYALAWRRALALLEGQTD